MLRKWVLAFVMATALAVALAPGMAMAAQGGLAAAQGDSPAQVATQAKGKKATVYVLTGVDGGTMYTYYDNGLLKSYSDYTFTYKGKNLKKIKDSYDDASYSVKSKDGLPKSAKYKSKTYKDVYTYTRNAKGVLTSEKVAEYSKSYGSKTWKKMKKTYTNTTDYTIKKGRQAKSVRSTSCIDKSSYVNSPISYSYDKKGNIKKKSWYMSDQTIYSFKYKKGLPTTKTAKYLSEDDDTWTSTYNLTYTKMQVNKSYVNVIKAQQWALLNSNLNRAFGPVNPGV